MMDNSDLPNAESMPAAADTHNTLATTAGSDTSLLVPHTIMAPDVDTAAADELTETVADSDSTAPTETDEQVVGRLAGLSQMDYDRARKGQAKKLGIQLSTLDDLVKAARNATPTVDLLPYEDLAPYPDPIDPALLLNEIVQAIQSLVILDPEQADGGALWVAHTHVADVADISPLGIINAPEKACAKTLLQTVFARMSKRPLQASNASLSAMFRAVESWKSTLFIDEADTFFKDNPELHGLVNAGYSKGGFVLRSEATGDSFEPRIFSVFGPKSIAGIALEKHLPDSTMSRGIVFNLRRKLPHETVQRMRQFDKSIFATIGSKLARFAQDYSQQLSQAKPHLPKELSDRQQDCWEPLLAIAQIAGPEWEARALKAALAMSMAAEASVSTGNELLSDIQAVFAAKNTRKISTVDLIAALVADEEHGWSTYNHGKQLTPRQLAKQLATYGIHSKSVRMPDRSSPKGYDTDQFADAFARYLTPPEKLPQRGNAAPSTRPVMVTVADTTQPSDPGGLDAFIAELDAERGGAADANGAPVKSPVSDDDLH
jgi:hypothetical protein